MLHVVGHSNEGSRAARHHLVLEGLRPTIRAAAADGTKTDTVACCCLRSRLLHQVDEFLMHMPSLSQAEQGAVLQVFILTAILGEPTHADTTLGQSYDWPRCTFDHEMPFSWSPERAWQKRHLHNE